MSLSQNLLLTVYQKAKHAGILDGVVAQELFWQSYSLYKRYLEDPFYNLGKLHPKLFSGGHILDVGANIGYTAKVFADLLDQDYRVFAFEPEPENFSKLSRHNARLIATGRLVIQQLAVGAQSTEVQLLLNPDHHADHKVVQSANDRTLKVQQTSLDDYCAAEKINNRVRFIKIDVQGYELAVCQGMQQVLSTARPFVALEYTPASMVELGFVPDELFALFEKQNYELAIISRSGQVIKVSWSELANKLLDRAYLDLLFYHRELSPF